MSNDTVVSLNMSYYGQNRGGGHETSLADNFRGKNWLGGPPNTPENDDIGGLNFIVKPDLNLHYDNIGTNRFMTPLNTRDPDTQQYAIKMCLDPTGALERGYSSNLVDPAYPFIPILDNTILDHSGWPDKMLNEYTSQAGRRKEQYGGAVGGLNNYGKWDLNIEHVNPLGSPVSAIYAYWLAYIANINYGLMSPYYQNVVKNKYDYMSRFYRFVLDYKRGRVLQWSCNGAMWPRVDNSGAVMNYTAEKVLNEGYETFSGQWTCYGWFDNDPRVLYEFNRCVVRFNRSMLEKEKYYTKVPVQYLRYFSYRGYPWVDILTQEFSVWVEPEYFRARMTQMGFILEEGDGATTGNTDELSQYLFNSGV